MRNLLKSSKLNHFERHDLQDQSIFNYLFILGRRDVHVEIGIIVLPVFTVKSIPLV